MQTLHTDSWPCQWVAHASGMRAEVLSAEAESRQAPIVGMLERNNTDEIQAIPRVNITADACNCLDIDRSTDIVTQARNVDVRTHAQWLEHSNCCSVPYQQDPGLPTAHRDTALLAAMFQAAAHPGCRQMDALPRSQQVIHSGRLLPARAVGETSKVAHVSSAKSDPHSAYAFDSLGSADFTAYARLGMQWQSHRDTSGIWAIAACGVTMRTTSDRSLQDVPGGLRASLATLKFIGSSEQCQAQNVKC
jgi:hypothetical protein